MHELATRRALGRKPTIRWAFLAHGQHGFAHTRMTQRVRVETLHRIGQATAHDGQCLLAASTPHLSRRVRHLL
eukprot:3141902-Prymnesium_polylepis.1